MFKRLNKYFSVPKRLVILNAILLIIGVSGNILGQIFCIPTPWAIVVLTICFINTIFFPLISNRKSFLPFLGFINGISFFVFIYCILFLEHMNWLGFIGILIFGIGLITFIPHFFAIQIFWKNLIKPKTNTLRLFFVLGIIVSISISAIVGFEYKNAIESVKKFKESGYEYLDKSFMTEKILGMHFIYHTRFCEYDGWRPPKHEPLLIMGMWLNNRFDPLDINLEKRIELYKNFYPDRKIKFNCSCGLESRNIYLKDELWK